MLSPRLAAAFAWLLMASCSSGGGRCSSPNRDAVGSPSPAQRDVDSLYVDAFRPGESASQVSAELTDPIETSVSKCDGIASTRGFSEAGRSRVALVAKTGVDASTLRACVREHLNAARPILPEDAELPIVRSHDTPVVALVALRDARRSTLDLHIEADRIRRAIEPISGVTETRICGPEPALLVTVDPVQLRSRALGIKAVIDALQNPRAGNTASPADMSIEGLGDAVIASSNGAPIKIRDVAILSLEAAPGSCRATDLSGEAVIAIEVHGSETAGGLLDAALMPVREAMPAGTTMTIQRTRDLAKVVVERVDMKGRAPAPKSSDSPGMVLDTGGSSTIVWLSAPKETGASWLVDLVPKLAPSPDWTPIAIEAPSARASAVPLWVALATTPECRDALPKLHDALAQRAVPGSVREVGLGVRTNEHRERTIEIDRERAADLGVNVLEIAQGIRAAVSGIPVTGRTPPVLVRLQVPDDPNLWMTSVDVPSVKGGLVPLAEVIRTREEPASGPLLRLDRENVVVVFALLTPGTEMPDEAWVQSKIGAPACRVIRVGSGEW